MAGKLKGSPGWFDENGKCIAHPGWQVKEAMAKEILALMEATGISEMEAAKQLGYARPIPSGS